MTVPSSPNVGNPDMQAAVHEAAHAVVGLVLGHPALLFVTLDHDSGPHTAFHMLESYRGTDGLIPDDIVRASLVSRSAGPIAEEKSSAEPDRTSEETLAELVGIASDAAEHFGDLARMENRQAGEEAGRMVEQLWPSILAVAEALVERRTLSREDVARLVERVARGVDPTYE